ncbi:MAG: Synechococcus phage [Bacteroidota bacterium]|jgi:hypothetical protein
MSRNILSETTYTFDPANRIIEIPKFIPREKLVLITNVTKNIVIFNFSDDTLKTTSYTNSTNADGTQKTTIVLQYNTLSMSATDKLQIVYDVEVDTFTPADAQLDPTNKFRVTQPQALIDTDFEYGVQASKWESLTMTNNRPFAYNTPNPVAVISSITMPALSKIVTVNLSSGTAPANGTPITVQDTYISVANGNFIIESGGGTNSFTYTARSANNTNITSIYDSSKTLVFSGALYTGAAIGGTPTISYSGNRVLITTTIPHGLSISNEVAITGTTASSNPPNGSFYVVSVPSPTQFVIYTNNTITGSVSGGTIYVRPQGQFLHRAFDGGVLFSANADGNYEQAVRQTRRYFRYQSGKGIQVSSGTILKPFAGIEGLTSVGTTVTVTTKEKHNILPGVSITISGCNEAAYNGTFTVQNITGFNTFTYTALSTPSSSIASGFPAVAVNNWFGAQSRLGMFDQQNGIFFEYDGQVLNVVRRNSTSQLSGRVSVTNGSTTVSQTNPNLYQTYFNKQLAPGDYIVLRGQSYRVASISSDTSLTISPAYRGATAQYVTVSKTVDKKVPQSQWNLDKCDGAGPSGYNIDLSKMQMFYMDYSWYGAGFIRWGVRGPQGNIIYVHKEQNNNMNTEAYMRSGNLPARYETQTMPPTTTITSNLSTSATTLSVASTDGFPSSGTIVIKDNNNFEYMNYSGKTATSFTGLTRAQSGADAVQLSILVGSNTGTVTSTTGLQVGQRVITTAFAEGTYISNISGNTLTFTGAAITANPQVTFAPMGVSTPQQYTYAALTPVGVELAWPTFSPAMSHWGTSVIMDGRYDDDKSLLFTYGQSTVTNISAGASRALFSIRIAPSVDSNIVGAFGTRELINRMQLILRALDISTRTASANMLVTAVLNGVPSTSTTWTNAVRDVTTVQNSSLAQIADYAGGSTTVSGGETTGGFFVSTTGSVDLNNVRDLGNSILGGGGTTANTQIYPDGPDTLTIVVQNIGTAAIDVIGRLSWTEAQA